MADGDLVKAAIDVLDAAGEPTDTIPVTFNPTTYTVRRQARYRGTGAGDSAYEATAPAVLATRLLFDTCEDGTPVTADTDRIDALLVPDPDTGVPPRCRFRWGDLDFPAVVEWLETRFTLFLPDGTPVRAWVDVRFRERPPSDDDEPFGGGWAPWAGE